MIRFSLLYRLALAGLVSTTVSGCGDFVEALTKSPQATPRLRRLSDAFADRQITVDVRRTHPLSLVLSQAGVEPLLPTLVEALERLSAVPAA